MSKAPPLFANEAELVAAFCAEVERMNSLTHVVRQRWTIYHETAGWDLLLVGDSGSQIGIEAKMSLNAKVLEQALPYSTSEQQGPDFRAVLVPRYEIQNHIGSLARHVGITIISAGGYETGGEKRFYFNPHSPPDSEAGDYAQRDWFCWHPAERCKVPDYVPDVMGGKASPVSLTEWKISAIKLVILLDRVGVVTRTDMKALKLSPSRWTEAWQGFLDPAPGGYVRNSRTPNFRAQHPVNYAQIEADFEKWGASLLVGRSVAANDMGEPIDLFGAATA